MVNGTQCASSYDNSITAAGLAGLSVYAPATPDSETEGVHFDEVIENIDIGGPSMIRSAAKNFRDVAVVTSPADYEAIAESGLSRSSSSSR